jgi:hypothetical protein
VEPTVSSRAASPCYLRSVESKDFWLLDFATNTIRQLTHFSERGFLNTFDVAPDVKYLVFDRTRQNSDIVLIACRSSRASLDRDGVSNETL